MESDTGAGVAIRRGVCAKGGRVKYTMPDGSTRIAELKTGEALIRPPVTHSDDALDDVEAILVEIKQ